MQDPVEQDEIPSTKPTLVETNDADSGSNPDESGVPAGALIAEVVVVEELVVLLELDVACVVEVVVVVADLWDELRLKPIRAAAITRTAIAEAKMILFCLVIAPSRFVM